MTAGILAEAKRAGAISSCWVHPGRGLRLGRAPAVPQKVAADADCSVLLVKEEQPITRILACLDQTYISQESLEMMNQMVTIHGAPGVYRPQPGGRPEKGSLHPFIEIGDYYEDRQVKVTTRLTEVADFENFLARNSSKTCWPCGWGRNPFWTASSPGIGWAASWPNVRPRSW